MIFFAVQGHEDRSKDKRLTSVYDLVLVTPVDGLDELVDVAADFVGRCTVGQFLQELQHVLQKQTAISPLKSDAGRVVQLQLLDMRKVCFEI